MAWLSGYSYRKQINITGQSGAGVGYQVKLTIGSSSGGQFHLEGHCQDFPNDIRFTDDDGETELSYWIEDVSADPIIAWVEVIDDLSTDQSIYCYYGRTGVSTTSNGDNTFDLFDDFPGSSLDGNKWTEVLRGTGSVVNVSGGECELYVPDNQTCSANIQSIQTFTNGIAITVRRKCPNDVEYIEINLGSGSICDALGGTTDWWFTGQKSSYWWINGSSDGSGALKKMPSSGSWIALTDDFPFNADDINNYRIYDYSYDSSGNIKWYIRRDDYRPLGEGFEKYENNPLSLPGDSTGYGATHPDVLYFPDGEDGYKFWMYYEKGVNSVGDDCDIYLVRSNDGLNWTEDGVNNPILTSIDGEEHIPDPDVVKVGSTWYLFLCKGFSGSSELVRLTSTDGISWSDPVTVIERGGSGAWDEYNVVSPSVIYEDGTFYMWYVGDVVSNDCTRVGLATSTDGENFTKDPDNPIYGTCDHTIWHIQVTKYNGYYWMYYLYNKDSGMPHYLAKSTDRKNFTASSYNPVMVKNGGWESNRLYRMSWLQDVSGNSVLLDGKMWYYYGANGGTYHKIGLAKSWEGINMGGGTELLASATDTDFLNDDKKILLTQGAYQESGRGAPSYLDWVVVRKYVDPEPTFSSAGAEESGGESSGQPFVKRLGGVPFMWGQRFSVKLW